MYKRNSFEQNLQFSASISEICSSSSLKIINCIANCIVFFYGIRFSKQNKDYQLLSKKFLLILIQIISHCVYRIMQYPNVVHTLILQDSENVLHYFNKIHV